MNDSRSSDASDRARAAGERVEELDERLRRLRAGEPVTGDDVERAELAASRGVRRSTEAHVRAYQAYRRAAESHRAMARALDARGHSAEAAEHRRLAEADDLSADQHAGRADEQGE